MKKISIKKFIALVLGMTMASTALAGCGQQEEDTSKLSSAEL